jgi:peptidyl-prolyl cis-trans isomerase A (cyclophilin A)
VANFIGLARGKRQWWNPKAGTWVASRYYDGLHFHRVIPEFLVQTGDPLNDGSGEIGYELPNENEDARYDEAGLLVMADEGEAGQFFITDGPASQLASEDTHYTVFGKCLQTDVIHRLARVPQSGRPDHRPITPTVLERVFVKRVRGGADKAERTAPKPARGMEGKPEGASPGPGAH